MWIREWWSNNYSPHFEFNKILDQMLGNGYKLQSSTIGKHLLLLLLTIELDRLFKLTAVVFKVKFIE